MRHLALTLALLFAGCGSSGCGGPDAAMCLTPTGATISVSCPMGGAAEMPMGGVIAPGTYDLDQYILWSSSCGSPRTAGGTLVVTGTGAQLHIASSTLTSATLFVCQDSSYHPSGIMLDPSTGYTADATGVTIYEGAGANWQRTSHWKPR